MHVHFTFKSTVKGKLDLFVNKSNLFVNKYKTCLKLSKIDEDSPLVTWLKFKVHMMLISTSNVVQFRSSVQKSITKK